MIPFVVQFMYRQWGTPETLKVVILIPLLTNVLGVGLWWLVYAISARMAGYLSVAFSGVQMHTTCLLTSLTGRRFPGGLRGPEVILMGALVAYAQTNPDASINLFLFVPVRVKVGGF